MSLNENNVKKYSGIKVHGRACQHCDLSCNDFNSTGDCVNLGSCKILLPLFEYYVSLNSLLSSIPYSGLL